MNCTMKIMLAFGETMIADAHRTLGGKEYVSQGLIPL